LCSHNGAGDNRHERILTKPMGREPAADVAAARGSEHRLAFGDALLPTEDVPEDAHHIRGQSGPSGLIC
jgi:hypothetical protein